MKLCAFTLAVLLVPTTASAADPDPFAPPWFFRWLAGAGSVPDLPKHDASGNVVLTAEVGGHPLSGAFASGLSISTTTDMLGEWFVVVPGVFAQLDLTSLFLTGLWAYDPPEEFPFRLQLGSRLGIARSESSRSDVANAPAYTLYRPELSSFLDLDIPFCDCSRALVIRAGVDTSVNLATLFRWSGSVGLSTAWGY